MCILLAVSFSVIAILQILTIVRIIAGAFSDDY